MSDLGPTCGHGKTWKETCPDCRMVSITESLKWMEPHVRALQNEQAALYAKGIKPFSPTVSAKHE